MVISEELAEALERAETLRDEIGFQGSLAQLLDAGVTIFVSMHAKAKIERAENALGRKLI